MGKVVYCNKVDPSSGCNQVIRGETEEEVLQKAKLHAQEHGIVDMTPELMNRVKSSIEDEKTATRT
jgi:predicted small metal-binding protein